MTFDGAAEDDQVDEGSAVEVGSSQAVVDSHTEEGVSVGMADDDE